MFVVDTNILVYAARSEVPEHLTCRRLLDGWRAGLQPWHITWSVVYEFLSVVTQPSIVRAPRAPAEAWTFIEGLLATPSLTVLGHTSAHAGAMAGLIAGVADLQGGFSHDAHIAALMREHGVRTIYTRDRAFRRFPFLEVIDPLSA
ncbi:MAG: PIN domain-containing protein [Dehalococcoidia bacterium]|nr:PIN domain-containing protein [Dehalococcoidia bacterium]